MTNNQRERAMALAHNIWSAYEYDTPDKAADLIEAALVEARTEGYVQGQEDLQPSGEPPNDGGVYGS